MEEPTPNIREKICSFDVRYGERFSLENATEFFKKKLYESIPSYTKLDLFTTVEVEIVSYDYDQLDVGTEIQFWGVRPETSTESDKRKKRNFLEDKKKRAAEMRANKEKERAEKKKRKEERQLYDKLKKKFETYD